jgi:hypothetical protein
MSLTFEERRARVHDLCYRAAAAGWGDYRIAVLVNAVYKTQFTRNHVKKLREANFALEAPEGLPDKASPVVKSKVRQSVHSSGAARVSHVTGASRTA